MDREERIVLRDQTFTDIAVSELADVKAKLLLYQYYNRQRDFYKFPVYEKLKICYEQMNEYDKLRVDNKASIRLGEYLRNPEAFLPYGALKRKVFFIWLIMFFICFITAISVSFVFIPNVYTYEYKSVDQPADYYMPVFDMDQAVHETICDLSNMVYDISEQQGIINCTDYAIEFKILWDMRYPWIPCKLIWFNKPGVFNHLLVCIKGLYIEPQTAWNIKGYHGPEHSWYSDIWDIKWCSDGQFWYDRFIKNRRHW